MSLLRAKTLPENPIRYSHKILGVGIFEINKKKSRYVSLFIVVVNTVSITIVIKITYCTTKYKL